MTEQHKILEKELKDALDKLNGTINKVLEEMFSSEGKTENEKHLEMKCPFKNSDYYWVVYEDGSIGEEKWLSFLQDDRRLFQGNLFPTKEAAKLESKRRKLLTQFRSFRDECNGDWKADWSNYDKKWSVSKNEDGLFDTWSIGLDTFSTLGYFKNQEDCERAIELFGDEIQKLFIDCECD